MDSIEDAYREVRFGKGWYFPKYQALGKRGKIPDFEDDGRRSFLSLKNGIISQQRKTFLRCYLYNIQGFVILNKTVNFQV